MNFVNVDSNPKLTETHKIKRHQIKNEIRKLKSQNKKTYKWIKFCDQDFSNYEKAFNNEILLFEELLEELMYIKDLLKISIEKNIEKINYYIDLLRHK